MKHLALVLLLIAGIASSCKKSGGTDVIVPVDPRDRTVGSYDVGGNIVISFLGKQIVEAGSGTVTVSKSDLDAAQIILDFNLTNYKERLAANLTGSTYSILVKTTEPIVLNGQTFVGQFTGSGQFTDKNEFTYVGVSEDTGLKKTTSITGTKK